MSLGLLLLCGSPAAWTLGFYLATALGLAALASEWERLPDFLPYVLFAGYLLLYLLAPVYDASPRSWHTLVHYVMPCYNSVSYYRTTYRIILHYVPSSVRLDVVRVGGFVWLEERAVEEAASPEDAPERKCEFDKLELHLFRPNNYPFLENQKDSISLFRQRSLCFADPDAETRQSLRSRPASALPQGEPLV